MILRTLINEAGKMIADAGIEECRFEAELLMAVTLGVSRFDILINQDMEISEEQKKFFFELVKRRVNREPSAYIMGYKEFMGLNFKVRPGILIPRPDTEILVETIIDTVKSRFQDFCRNRNRKRMYFNKFGKVYRAGVLRYRYKFRGCKNS